VLWESFFIFKCVGGTGASGASGVLFYFFSHFSSKLLSGNELCTFETDELALVVNFTSV